MALIVIFFEELEVSRTLKSDYSVDLSAVMTSPNYIVEKVALKISG